MDNSTWSKEDNMKNLRDMTEVELDNEYDRCLDLFDPRVHVTDGEWKAAMQRWYDVKEEQARRKAMRN